MILLDTNVVIDAFSPEQENHRWALAEVSDAVASSGAGVNVVTVAELFAGRREGGDLQSELARFGVRILDLPAAAGDVCGKAYRNYVARRLRSGGGSPPKTPLPDFFIGAHAQIMGWKLATRDVDRYAAYFPGVILIKP